MSHPVVYVALQQFCEESDQPRKMLLEAGCEIRQNALGRRLKAEEMRAELDGADAVIAGIEPYDAALLASLPRLRCISRCGVGTDSIDLEAARQRGITVYTTPEEVVAPVAELTVAMLFSLARNLHLHAADLHGGAWRKRSGFLLSEWTIGLIGLGRIGRAVAERLRPFGPRLLAADPNLTAQQLPPGISLVELPTLLGASDAVSLHAVRPQQAGPLLGARELGMMKPGSRLVNTSRGHLVDEHALLEALQSGRLSAAALDVFGAEPYAGPLAALPQVLCTPHVASLTRASRAAMELRCARQAADHFAARRHAEAKVA